MNRSRSSGADMPLAWVDKADTREGLFLRTEKLWYTWLGSLALYYVAGPLPEGSPKFAGVSFSGFGLRDRLPAFVDIFSHAANVTLSFPAAAAGAALSAGAYRLASGDEFRGRAAKGAAVLGAFAASLAWNYFFMEAEPVGGAYDALDTTYGTLVPTAAVALTLSARSGSTDSPQQINSESSPGTAESVASEGFLRAGPNSI